MERLKTIRDPRGCLTVAEGLPFPVKRVYFLHHITGNRGGHAHRALDRLFIAVAGSLTVSLNGAPTRLWTPEEALRVPPLTWVELTDFTPDAICLVLASAEYEESDYIRSYEEFASVAQSVERGPCKAEVAGSNPSR